MSYHKIIQKNEDKNYHKPRHQPVNNCITIDDVIYKPPNDMQSYTTDIGMYINKNPKNNKIENKKTVNKNNKKLLLKYLNQEADLINAENII